MRILIVTDSWPPVVSGVVTTYQTIIGLLREWGHEVELITPDQFYTVPLPTDTHLRVAVLPAHKTVRLIKQARPEAIHIAVEGTLGIATRNWCARRQIPFTTAYTTKLPEYLHARTGVPTSWTYKAMHWFHRPSAGVMVSTETLARDLEARGFGNIVRWGRGVDLQRFRPRSKDFLAAPRPIQMYVGRVAVEKNIEAFLQIDAPGTKFVVGDGPQLPQLRAKYPQVRFVGNQFGEDLASYFAAADVFVFPSRTDTYGLVMLEALASGVPVAAYPVPGPLDVIGNSGVGVLSEDLGSAVQRALSIDPHKCRRYAQRFGWGSIAEMFLRNLRPLEAPARRLAA